MGRDQDKGEFEWVNSWVAETAPPVEAAQVVAATPISKPALPPVAPDQLMRDIADIERVRDVLAALPVAAPLSTRATQALTLVPPRRTDIAPVVIGGVLALVMLTVFGAAAAMTKISR